MRIMLRRAVLALAGLTLLSGCAAISALSGSAAALDAYALRPLPAVASQAAGPHLVVALPSASGAIATDRILVRPSPLQAAYLPGVRWVDPVPQMVQTLLVQSLQGSGAFALVGRDDAGLFPDVTLIGEVRTFEAVPGAEGGATYTVRVALDLALIREADARVAGSRRFEARAEAASAAPLAVAAAFDAAMGAILREALPWVAGRTGGV